MAKDWSGLDGFWNRIKAGDSGWDPGKALEYLIIRAFELSGFTLTTAPRKQGPDMKLNVVCEGITDAKLLQLLFEMRFPEIEPSFYAGQGKVNAAALASSVLFEETHPVLLVRDADTYDKEAQKERNGLAASLMRQRASEERFRVFSFSPEIEVIFWEMGALDLSSIPPLYLAQKGPKAALETYLEKSEEGFHSVLRLVKEKNCWDSSEQIQLLKHEINSLLASQVANV